MLDSTPPDELLPHRFTRDEYEQVLETEALADMRVELLRGAIVEMTPISPLHDDLVNRLTEMLVGAVGARASVRTQSSFAATEDSVPQPDLAVVPRRTRLGLPHPRVAWLVIEVEVSSPARDFGTKAAIYAEAGVEEYWVVDANARTIVAMRDPRDGVYATRTERAHGVVPLARLPGVEIDVAALFA